MNNPGLKIIESIVIYIKHFLEYISYFFSDLIDFLKCVIPFLIFLAVIIFGIFSLSFVGFYVSCKSSDYIIKTKPLKEDDSKETIYNADYYLKTDHGNFLKIVLLDSKDITINTNGHTIEIIPVPEGSLNDAK